MSFTRARALRSLQSTLRHSGARTIPRARTQLVAKRFASSGGHGHAEPSSDLPWLLGGIVVTVPSCWYLWPEKHADGGHHDEHHGAQHEEKGDEKEAEEDAQEDSAPAEQSEEPSDSGKEEKAATETPAEGEEKPSGEEAPSGDDAEESQGEESESKSAGSGSGKKPLVGERKTEPDSKGALKKRIDSPNAQNLGAGTTSETDAGKQHGISNTDTKHSVKIDEPGSEKSTKGEGAPETAKVKGAVDPSRPQK